VNIEETELVLKKKTPIMADDSSTTTTRRFVNLNSLYEQAYKFSDSSSWYKHIKDSATVFIYLVAPIPRSKDPDVKVDAVAYSLDVVLEWKGRGIDIPNGVSSSMAESSKKYPVTITPELDGHDGPAPRVARYMFDRYLFFLKRHGFAQQDATELPQHGRRTNPLELDRNISDYRSITISSCNSHHEKWRMIGLIVRAACNIARDEGIEVVDTPPYPPNSAAWNYLKSDEERLSNEAQ
jgi:hypothetical protein